MTARQARRAKVTKEILIEVEAGERCVIVKTPGRGGFNCEVRLLDFNPRTHTSPIAYVPANELDYWHGSLTASQRASRPAVTHGPVASPGGLSTEETWNRRKNAKQRRRFDA